MVSARLIRGLAATASLAAVLANAAPALAAAQPPVVFTLSSEWTLTERPETCVMTRQFAAGEQKVLLQLESWASSRAFRVTVATEDFRARNRKLRFGFLPGEPETEEMAAYAKLGDGRNAVIFGSGIFAGQPLVVGKGEKAARPTAAEASARETAIASAFLGDAFDRDLKLQTGSMRPAMIVMNSCMAALLRRHGLDPAAIETIVEPAHVTDASGGMRALQEIYSSKMIREHGPAELHLRLLIDTTGKATDCFALPDAGHADLMEQACGAVLQGVFEPARDAAGNAVASFMQLETAYTSVTTSRAVFR